MDKIKQAGIGNKIVELWHLGYSGEMIAERIGHVVTGRSVLRYLYKQGINTGHTKKTVVCEHCGKSFDKARYLFRKSYNHYCSHQCYWDHLYNPTYAECLERGCRQIASKRARAMVRRCGYLLAPEQVVHHKDSNLDNSEPNNLMVFASQSDHMTWHRLGGPDSGVKPVWP